MASLQPQYPPPDSPRFPIVFRRNQAKSRAPYLGRGFQRSVRSTDQKLPSQPLSLPGNTPRTVAPRRRARATIRSSVGGRRKARDRGRAELVPPDRDARRADQRVDVAGGRILIEVEGDPAGIGVVARNSPPVRGHTLGTFWWNRRARRIGRSPRRLRGRRR